LFRSVVALLGLYCIGVGLRAILVRNDLHYTNWFGGLVFAPVVILLGAIIVLAALFKPEMLVGKVGKTKR
jgi:hypothetical protein